nr:CBS domain-containing protein [Kiloniellales bacterium]
RAREYIKVHGRKAGDVMTRDLISVTEETPLYEIAGLLEKHHVKRVPVTRDGRLIGIVSRANLLHGFAAKEARTTGPGSSDDQTIRENLLHTLAKEAGLDMALINVIVNDGVVQLWGLVGSGTEKKAAQVSAESTPGVKRVENHLGQAPTVV